MATAPPVARPAGAGDDYIASGRSAWMDVDWREHQRWLEIDGRQVNLIDVGEGPAVLLVHGLAGSWQNWLENIPHLAESHRVVAMDLPGFGYSEMPDDELTISGYVRCLEELCRQLEIDRAAVVGNSMGGFVGADMAIAHPQRVSRLVLVAAAVMWNERRRARPLATLSEVTGAYTALVVNQFRQGARRPRLRAATLSQVVRYPRRIPPPLAHELLRHAGTPEAFTAAIGALFSYKLRERLPEIACPTLVVWGTHDALVPVKHAHAIAEAIPDSQVEIFPDTGHVPMLERPARFNRLVDEFLAG